MRKKFLIFKLIIAFSLMGIVSIMSYSSVLATQADTQEMTKTQNDSDMIKEDIENSVADSDEPQELPKEKILLSDSYQIFNVQEDNNLTFIYKLPTEAIGIFSEKLGDTVYLYIDSDETPIDSSNFIVTSIDEDLTRVTLEGDYLRKLSIEEHTLNLLPYGKKENAVAATFLIRQVAKYETMRIGSETELTPMNVIEDNMQEWIAKEKIWTTSNEKVVTVDNNGIATGKSEGQAEIKATYADGTYDLWIVTVEAYNGIFVTEDFGDFSNGEKEPINWITVRKSGVDFAVLRYAIASEKGIEEYKYDNYEGGLSDALIKASEQGLKTGIVFKTAAKTKQAAIDEANLLLEKIKDFNDLVDLPIVYDVMIYGYDSNRIEIAPDILTTKEDCADPEKLEAATPIFTDIVSGFTKTMEDAGYKTMIYFSKYSAEVIDVKALHDNGVGLVFYNCDNIDNTVQPIIKDSQTSDVWFYAGDRYVEGATNENGKTWMLMGYTEYIDSVAKEEPTNTDIEYNVLEGADQKFDINKDKNLAFRFDLDYTLFNKCGKVYIDGNYVDTDKYTSKEGSTVITFNNEYTKTLELGEHNIEVALDEGKLGIAKTSFTITKTTISSNPATGDNIAMFIGITILAVVGVATIVVIKKKMK